MFNDLTPELRLRHALGPLGPQSLVRPTGAAQQRARFFNSVNAFDLQLSEVPARHFVDESDQVRYASTPTAFVNCDQSSALGASTPATTPLMLARYARIRAGESIATHFEASGTICYVISGRGSVVAQTTGDETESIPWSAGDVLFLPGQAHATYRAADTDCVLWLVTDEPWIAATGCRPVPTDKPAHYPASEIRAQIEALYAVEPSARHLGRALIFSNESNLEVRNIHPMMTLSLNTLPPGSSQAAHRHNSAAITLVLEGDNCHSMIDGEMTHWWQWSTLVTPPTAVHSHHNEGARRALFLIVQDGGLYYRARTMGFSDAV